jgi:2-polyprenyl-3-methyl-5-hydroxy-6-metoxy-1,4-benzoquinol methylase
VVIAGGRESPHWEAYPHHQFLSTVGALPCCAQGGCWKSRCQPVGDGDPKDRHDLCENPVQLNPALRIPRCLHLFTPADVIRRIELYHEGGALSYPTITFPAPTPVTRLPTHNLLLEFRHGLGDAVQLTSVLKHLRHYHPTWNIDVAALPRKHSAYRNLCRRSLVLDRDPLDRAAYDQTWALDWHECRSAFSCWPSTKTTQCLLDVFHLNPIPDLCTYTIHPDAPARRLACLYLQAVCGRGAAETLATTAGAGAGPSPPSGEGPRGRPADADGALAARFPAVLIHYQGNTSSDQKDLPHDLVRELCDTVLRLGYVPLILDWDRRSPLPDGVRIFNPDADHELWAGFGTGDAGTLAALIEASALMVGVDSGPLHVAGATSTPAIAVWTHHHPVHYFDLAPNVTHLVPGDHARLAAGPDALTYFEQNYRHRPYRQLYVELPALVESLLTGRDIEQLANSRFLGRLSATGFTERYYQEHKLAGLDYLGFGDWQIRYGRWLVESLVLSGKRLLDVGCACGSILRGLGQAGAIVQGVDLCEAMIRRGREHWPDMAPQLHVCDAVNLHLFSDGSWDAVHSAQVAEHWKPELVPFILRELARVTTPGGLLFCCLDTEEMFARQGRRLETEDPTHVCIRPMTWWHDRLAEAGWQVCTADFEPALRSHPDSFLKRYDWDWFLAKRI